MRISGRLANTDNEASVALRVSSSLDPSPSAWRCGHGTCRPRCVRGPGRSSSIARPPLRPAPNIGSQDLHRRSAYQAGMTASGVVPRQHTVCRSAPGELNAAQSQPVSGHPRGLQCSSSYRVHKNCGPRRQLWTAPGPLNELPSNRRNRFCSSKSQR